MKEWKKEGKKHSTAEMILKLNLGFLCLGVEFKKNLNHFFNHIGPELHFYIVSEFVALYKYSDRNNFVEENILARYKNP